MAVASIAIVGPTACGKTRRAVAVASRLGGEILSADSRQIYRGMTIGTGKDLEEYGDIPYHLIDICDAGEKYNLYKYLKEFRKAYDEVLSRSRVPVICGGSGMYVENAVKGILMPEVPENKVLREFLQGKNLDELAEILSGYKTLHNTTDIDNCKRVIGVDIPRNIRRERISARLRQRLDAGMIDEVRSIIDGGVDADDLIYYGLEYKYVTLHVVGRISYDEMFHDLEIAIHQFAKRQMTWFRGMETRGTKINWLPYDLSDDEFVDRVEELFFAG